MAKQKFELEEPSQLDFSSKGSLVSGTAKKTAWRKILVFAVVVAAIVAGIVALVFVMKAEDVKEEKPQTKAPVFTPKPPEKQSWLDESCLTGTSTRMCPWERGRTSPLLVIKTNGFLIDAFNDDIAPVIRRLMDCGVHTTDLRSVYPRLLLPNVQTMVTGLYPESHSIIDNTMYDGAIGEEFEIRTRKDEWWGGEPIWVSAKNQGKRSAAYNVPMSSASEKLPDYQVQFDSTRSVAEGVHQIMKWLQLPESERPDFMMLHASEMNQTKTSEEGLGNLNKMLLTLMEALYENNMDHCVNIILIADQGISPTSCEDLGCYTDTNRMLIHDGTIGRIHTGYRCESEDIVKNTNALSPSTVVSELECRSTHYKAFTKETLPARYHYTNNARIGDVVVDVDDKWIVSTNMNDDTSCTDGPDKIKQALFLGYGPSFHQNVKIPPFETIELYNIMCDLLEITPTPNNGTQGALHHLLRDPPALKTDPPISIPYCPAVNTPWTGLQSCTCSETDQRAFISRVTTTPATSTPGLDSPSFYTEGDMCNLDQTSYRAGYSSSLHMARWVAATLTSQQEAPTMSEEPCVVPDNRVTTDHRVNSAYSNIKISNLLPDNHLSETCGNIALSSTFVPMYTDFRKGIWQYVWELVHSYAESAVSVTVGPIFDGNHDGRMDTRHTRHVDTDLTTPIPTHFYMLLVRCKDNTETLPCEGNIETLALVLPHTETVPNCLDYKTYIEDNMVRIRDLELLTGLHFLDQLPAFSSMATRLYIGHELWPSTLSTREERNRTQNAPERWMDWTCPSEGGSCQADYQPVLVLCLDGFSADYINNDVTPVIKRLMKHGVTTPGLRPVYPSYTFPNMYTIVTGLYPESHGIVDNSLFDASMNSSFYIGGPSSSDTRWWGGLPIWQTAQKQGKRSAAYFWVGSDYEVAGSRPNMYRNYSKTVPFSSRLNTVMEWMSLPIEERPDILTFYFHEPDSYGHDFGPQPEIINPKLREMDKNIEELMEALYKRKLHNCVNLILLTDHGMTHTPCEQKEDLACYTDINRVLIDDGSIGRIYTQYHLQPPGGRNTVRNQNAPSVREVVSDLECRSKHFKVFTKETIPARYHYAYNSRIGEVVLDVESGWGVERKKRTYCLLGNHGFDNNDESMQALFVAHGPAFKQKVVVPAFENIQVYNLLCDLLNITPAPNNGTHGALHNMLKRPPSTTSGATSINVPPCPTLSNAWTGLQQCSCSESEQKSFINMVTDSAMEGGMDSPALYTSDTMCRLNQRTFLTGFSHTLHTARWVATTVTPQQAMISPNMSENICIVSDNRLSLTEQSAVKDWLSSPRSPDDNITMGNLLPDNYMKDDCGSIVLSSTLVHMYSGFKKGIWQYAWEMVYSYASTSTVSVTAGPIFDHNHDGHADTGQQSTSNVSLPTHFYMLLVRCKDNTETLPCEGNIETLALVLPHTETVPNCLDYNLYLKDNMVRILDLELLTGLHFLDQFPASSSLETRLYMGHELWPSTLSTREESPRIKSSAEQWMNMNCPSEGTPCTSDYKPVLLVSLDGFRADYLSKNVTPVIKKLIKHGVHTHYMRPVYPTYTYPNHYTLVTGLYPESHGIVGNKMYDLDMRKAFNIGSYSSRDQRWWGGEPMWLTSKWQGKKSASYFWVGSDIPVQGEYPNFYRNYTGEPFEKRVKTVLEWMSLPQDERPEFITLYFNEPDSTGHKYGPYDTENLNPALKEVDDMLGLLMAGLVEKGLHNCVNIIVLADHGMTPRSCDRAVALDDVLYDDEQLKMAFYTSMHGRISNEYSRRGTTYTVYEPPERIPTATIMDKLQCLSPHMRTYLKEDLPKRHHFVNNRRIEPIVLDVDNEWIISRFRNPKSGCSGASHGEDNIYASEGALFLAHGPAFKEGVEVEPFENIEIYNLIADVLGITPAPNNGTSGALHHLLKNPPKFEKEPILEYEQCTTVSPELDEAMVEHCNCSTQTVSDPTLSIDLPAMLHMASPAPCLTSHGHQTSAFSSDIALPKWSTVYLNVNHTRVEPENPGCVTPDPSLSTEDRDVYRLYENSELGVEPASLLTGIFAECGSISLSSSLVPMYTRFREGMWKYTWALIDSYLDEFQELQVTAGPIWDYQPDGLHEETNNHTRFVDDEERVVLPTHFFLVISKCRAPDDRFPCSNGTDVLPLILPHRKAIPSCETLAHHVFENVARLRDIEQLTGLVFFSHLETTESLSLRLFLPTSLWSSPFLLPREETGSWMDHTCETDTETQCPSDYKPVVMIAMDGFSAEYLERFNVTPVIQRLATCGIHASSMKPVYPTTTFPSFYSIATGLYPESHGIIANNMYDPELDAKFELADSDAKEDARWSHGEPIWQTVKKAGKKSASIFMPGSDVKGKQPNYFKRYLKGNIGDQDRLDTALYWLTRPADRRPDFISLYFSEPDGQGHSRGPDHETTREKLREMDGLIEYFMDALYRRKMHNCVNIILLADHGMAKRSCNKVLSLKSYFTSSELRKMTVYEGAAARISNQYLNGNKPLPQPLILKDTILERLQCQSKNMRVYDKTQLPVRHHYVNNIRIDDIIIDVDEKWQVAEDTASSCGGGTHGYDNMYRSMGALFVAHGPVFKQRLSVGTFESIQLHNLLSTILGVVPAPNNGTLGSLNHLLRNPSALPDTRQQPNYQACSNDVDTFTSLKQATCSCVASEDTSVLSPTRRPSYPVSSSNCEIWRGPAVSVYSQQLNMPLWAALTVSQEQANSTLYTNDPVCVVPDPSLGSEDRIMYTRYPQDAQNISVASLLPGMNDGCLAAQASSLVVPMYEAFRTGIWRSMWTLVSSYADKYGTLTVTVGPVFDYNSDGRYEGDLDNITRYVDDSNTVPFPTHYFALLSLCNSSLPCTDDLEILSFILPHRETSVNCLDDETYLLKNTARVRDIELITGLSFFTDLPVDTAARLTTFSPSQLWGASAISDDDTDIEWHDLPCPGVANNTCSSSYQPLLLIGLDGFRPDFLDRGLTPNLQRLLECGSHSTNMRPSYPTLTFPNFYTIITGLYPESHGIVENTMYDPELDKKFRIGGIHNQDPGWWGGEPLWVTAKRQGKKTASYFWIGSEVAINGTYPDMYRAYDGDITYVERVETIVEWMTLPAGERPDFLTLYFDQPDKSGHTDGPDSYEVDVSLETVDEVLGRLMQLLHQKDLHNCVNIAIVSDHGLAPVECDRLFQYSQFYTSSELRTFYVYEGAFSHISNTYKYGSRDQYTMVDNPTFSLAEIRERLRCNNSNVKVLYKEEIPRRRHYANNDRIEGLYFDVSANWTASRYRSQYYCQGGTHGYDNIYPTMHAFFMAYGPAFRINTTIGPFENIELYNLMTDVLDITPAPNNGTQGSLNTVLRSPKELTRTQGTAYVNSSTNDDVQTLVTKSQECGCPLSSLQASSLLNHTLTSDPGKSLPFGLPVLRQSLTPVQLLYQPNFVMGYSPLLQQPLWVSYTVSVASLAESSFIDKNCTFLDPRLTDQSQSRCDVTSNSSLSQSPLIHINYWQAGDDTYRLSSSWVPMLKNFTNGIWSELQRELLFLTMSLDEINVLTGPIFDHNHNGQFDETDLSNGSSSIPSDFFTIVTRCESGGSSSTCDTPDVLAFILPHRDSYDYNCQNSTEYLEGHTARVRDVELLTGLELFPSLPVQQAIQLRTALTTSLWKLGNKQ